MVPRKAFLEMAYGGLRYAEELVKPFRMDMIEVAVRWIVYHSMLGLGDNIILGASKAHYLAANVGAIQTGPLPDYLVAHINKICDPAAGINTKCFYNQGRVRCNKWNGSQNPAKTVRDLWASGGNRAREVCNLWAAQQAD